MWVIIAAIIAIIDQITKYAISKSINTGDMVPVIDGFFYLTLHKNPGAAWGMFQNGRVFFIIAVPVISAVIIYCIIRYKNSLLRVSLAMVLGGAVGNYIDRLLAGKVTDFLLFYIGSYPFPIFNVADIAITCGTILLAVYILFIHKEPDKNTKSRDELKDAE